MKRSVIPAFVTHASDSVLTVSPIEEDHAALERIFHDAPSVAPGGAPWRLSRTLSLTAAAAALGQAEFAVVVCERDLAPGSWRDVLAATANLPRPPLLIVTSLHADNYLWAEALNIGAYDVVAKPFDRGEVVRVVSFACLRWRREHRTAGPQAALSTNRAAGC